MIVFLQVSHRTLSSLTWVLSMFMCKNFLHNHRKKNSFHLYFFIFCRFGHRRKIKDHPHTKRRSSYEFRPKKSLFFFFTFAWTAEFLGDDENLCEIIWLFESRKNLSNDLNWILLRHILSRNFADGLTLIHQVTVVYVTKLFSTFFPRKLPHKWSLVREEF